MFAKNYRSKNTLRCYTTVVMHLPKIYYIIIYDVSRGMKLFKYTYIKGEQIQTEKELFKNQKWLYKSLCEFKEENPVLFAEKFTGDIEEQRPAEKFVEYLCDSYTKSIVSMCEM